MQPSHVAKPDLERSVPAMDAALADAIAPDRERYRAAGLWSAERLGERVAEFAKSKPDFEAVVDLGGARRTTFRELDRLSNRLANWMTASGLRAGDIVAAQLPNCLEAVVVAIAANKLGIVVNPIMTVYRAKELRYILQFSRAKAVFIPDVYRGFSHRDMLAGLARELSHEFITVVVDVVEGGSARSSAWLDGLSRWPDTPSGKAPAASEVSVILFTSGTEAAPKAVMHTEETLNANIRSVWQSLGMGDDEVIWMPSPVGHSTGFNFGIRFALLHGARLVFQDRWNPDEALTIIQRERPTFTLAATIFLTDLLRAADARSADLSSLRVFGCGGAPIPPHVVTDAAERGVNVLRLYGQTETLVATLNVPSSPLPKRIETDGIAIHGMTVDIRDDQGNPVPRGTEGELWATGPGLCVGYYKDTERTKAKFQDGWVRTGDVATMDADGYMTIVGRKSEIIIRGGLNIAPREIENEIGQIPGVTAVAVIGLPDKRLGEVCCACVVTDGSVALTLDAINQRLRETGMASFKLPQRLELVPELPTTASGKIQRHVLVAALSAPKT
ncbi:MAG: AMP-binding protein [Alphaproteobacteria bacterium]